MKNCQVDCPLLVDASIKTIYGSETKVSDDLFY